MNFLKEHKMGILVVVVIVIAFVLYSIFFTGEEDEIITSETSEEASIVVGADLLGMLLELKSLTLDSSVFSNEIFRALVDYSVDLAPQPIGRDNPFAPIGFEGSGPEVLGDSESVGDE